MEHLYVGVAAGYTVVMGYTNVVNKVWGTAVTLCYFIFTVKPNPVLKAGVEGGKWVIMVTLGAAFGAGIMGRISLLIGRLFLVFQDWIPLIKKV